MVFFNRTDFGEVRSKRDKGASETDFRTPRSLQGSDASANSFEILKETEAIFSAGTSSRQKSGGWGGIRTHDTLLTYTHFPGARLRPLGHPSTKDGIAVVSMPLFLGPLFAFFPIPV